MDIVGATPRCIILDGLYSSSSIKAERVDLWRAFFIFVFFIFFIFLFFFFMAGSILPSTLLFLTLLVTSAQAATKVIQCPSDPYQDPRNDPCNPLGYIPNNALTAIAFGYVLLVVLIQTYQIIYNGARWMLPMVIGEYIYALGFAFRFAVHNNLHSLGIYISEDLMIVLSPCFFIAANYTILGRLAREIDCAHHILLPVRRLTLIFVLSDVTTFVIQAGGASMTTSTVPSSATLGLHIFLVGLIMQLVSFVFFCIIYARFLYKVYSEEQDICARDSKKHWNNDWRTLAAALAVSCVGLLIRSFYRVVEASQGFRGNLSTSEAAFYLGDTIPICLAIVVYVPFWPGRFIENKPAHPYVKEQKDLSVSSTTLV